MLALQTRPQTSVVPFSKPQAAQSFAPRIYQRDAIKDVYRKIHEGYRRLLLISTMGTGKTTIATLMMQDAASRGKRSVFLVTATILIEQTVATLKRHGITPAVLQGKRKPDPGASCLVVSLQTVAARLKRGQSLNDILGDVRLFIADEAHVSSFHKAYKQLEEFYLPFGAVFLGLTATPWRLSNKEWLRQRFDESIVVAQPFEMVKQGYVLSCRGFTLKGALDLDLLELGKDGDYVESQIANQATRPEAQANIFQEWQRLASDRPTMLIGATCDQVLQHCEFFRSKGIISEVVIGSTPQAERETIFERLKAGETQVLMAVGALSYGFDCPPISAILYVRATRSKALFHQSAGRGSRPYPGKEDYFVLDFGGNLKRFGNPMARQDYSIDQPQQREAPTMTKTCPGCSHEVPQMLKICPHCGYEFLQSEEGFIEEEEEDIELPYTQLNEFFDTETRNAIKQLRIWKRESYLLGQSPDLPIDRFRNEYGYAPALEWMQNACISRRYSQKRLNEFLTYLQSHCKNNQFAEAWRRYHLRVEFGTDAPEGARQLVAYTDWRECLRVSASPTLDEVKRAYRNLAREWHPDVCGESIATETMKVINMAFAEAKDWIARARI